MFILEWAIGKFGAENIELIIYLTGLALTLIFYIIGLISNWKINYIGAFLSIAILSIISNITELKDLYIYSVMIILSTISILALPKKEIKHKIIPNILSLFLIFIVFSTGIFILIDATNETITTMNTKIK